MNETPWTALVVEDEPRLREALLDLLRASSFPWAALHPAGDAETALALAAAHRPDVAFLDIRLPGLSGLDLAARLPEGIHLVFVTAYESHALRAFEAGALDYLLKPVTAERLQATLVRLRARAAPAPLASLQAWLETALRSAPPEPLRWITATVGRRTHWVPVEDIVGLQADQKYTRLLCAGTSYLVAQSLKDLLSQLDPRTFQQVHRSAAVNLRAVAWVERGEGEGGQVHLRGHEAPLPVSAPYLKGLLDRR